jgi:hypothetical protein
VAWVIKLRVERPSGTYTTRKEAPPVIALGVILLILGYVFGISIVCALGFILLITGVILLLLGGFGRPVGGRTWYY